jgi:hypothetical protein
MKEVARDGLTKKNKTRKSASGLVINFFFYISRNLNQSDPFMVTPVEK